MVINDEGNISNKDHIITTQMTDIAANAILGTAQTSNHKIIHPFHHKN